MGDCPEEATGIAFLKKSWNSGNPKYNKPKNEFNPMKKGFLGVWGPPYVSKVRSESNGMLPDPKTANDQSERVNTTEGSPDSWPIAFFEIPIEVIHGAA